MKKILAVCLLAPTLCFANGQYVEAYSITNPSSSLCKVLVGNYHAGSSVGYVGDCGWFGLTGIGGYVQTWNHSNHVRVVRGVFSSGEVKPKPKVTHINNADGTITTYEQGKYMRFNVKTYQLDDVLTDAKQAGLNLGNDSMAYIKLANYVDVFE